MWVVKRMKSTKFNYPPPSFPGEYFTFRWGKIPCRHQHSHCLLTCVCLSPAATFSTTSHRGSILGRNWDQNLKTFAPCCFYSPHGLRGLEICTLTAESRWGLALFKLSLCLPLKVAMLFFLFLLFIYIWIHIVLTEATIRNALKGGKPNRKPYHPYGCRNLYKKSINEENSSLFMNSIL